MKLTYSQECKLFENCATGWEGHYLCGQFYCCSRLCPVLPVSDPSSCCYLCLVVLVVTICASRLSQMLFDWSIVTYIFSHLFLWAVLMHILDVCVYQLLVATITMSCSGCRCILQGFFLLLKCIKLFVYLGHLCDWSCWFSDVLVTFAGKSHSTS